MIKMVYVHGGTFMMGTPGAIDEIAYEEEFPAHEVTLDSYYISETEITVAQFAEFVETTGYLSVAELIAQKGSWCTAPSGKDTLLPSASWRCDLFGQIIDSTRLNLPVAHVSYYDAVEFCKYLSIKEDKKYRLPTEAEWEYAASGGRSSNNYQYSGDDNLDKVGWFNTNSESQYHPVAQKNPNELGLYDMSGNLMEWCLDDYVLYTEEPQNNPLGKATGTRRIVARGGGWSRYPSDCRVKSRRFFTPSNRGGGIGFRVVCEVD